MIVRNQGHASDVIVISNQGNVLKRFQLNDSPNETGMETVFWDGPDHPALLYNGGMLWRSNGKISQTLPGLDPPGGPARMGWYHCIPADICGDSREELILYNPWDTAVYVYTQESEKTSPLKAYHAGPRQYNARIMD